VTHRRMSVIVRAGFPNPVSRARSESRLGSARGGGAGEAVAPREALALAGELGLLPLATLDHLEELQRLRL
jgi:hypothetical protein